MKKKLILFDFDGTVIDNSEGIYHCIGYALRKKEKKPLPEEILRKFIGPSLFDSFMTFVEEDEKTANELVRLYREEYAPVGSTMVRVYDGIRELIDHLREEGFITAVCSSKPYDFVVKIAAEQKLSELFDGFYCPGFGSLTSDKAGLALSAISDFSVSKEEAVLIGDTKFDVRSAKQAGIECIGVRYGFSEEGELEREGADYIVSDVNEIFSLIAGETK